MKNTLKKVAMPAHHPFSSASSNSPEFFHDRHLEYKLRNSNELLRSARTEHGQLARLYQLLKRASETFISVSDREVLFARVNEILSESNLFSVACISIAHPMTGELGPVTWYCDLRFQQSLVNALFDNLFVGYCAGTARQFRVINDLGHDAPDLPWRKLALEAGLRAFASSPITFENQFYGTITAFAESPDYFGSDVIDLLRQLAEGVSSVLHRLDESVERQTYELGLSESRRELRELLLHLHAAREDERSLIARELHDELGQTLNTLKLDLCALGSDQKIKVPAQEQRLARMTEAIDHALEEVHRVVSVLCPRILADLGLGPAIEWLISDFIDHSGISCRLEINAPQHEVPRAIATTAFRCIQECLTNIRQHSTATSLSISAQIDRSLLNLAISDNGRIDTHSGPTANSFGNISMRQRVELLGGTLRIINRHSRGTTIEIALPIVHQAE